LFGEALAIHAVEQRSGHPDAAALLGAQEDRDEMKSLQRLGAGLVAKVSAMHLGADRLGAGFESVKERHRLPHSIRSARYASASSEM
jgi:hypothetical protein